MAINTDAIEQAFNDNADYHESNDVAKGRRFVSACRRFIAFIPTSTMKGPNSVSIGISEVRMLLKDAEEWLLTRDPTQTQGPRRALGSFRYFRR